MKDWVVSVLLTALQVPFIYINAINDSNVIIANSIAFGACGTLAIVQYRPISWG